MIFSSRLSMTALVVALISAASAAPAVATVITLNENFTITGYNPGTPLTSLSGTFSLSFDNSADQSDVTGTVLTLSVPDISLAGTITVFFYNHAADFLTLGDFPVGEALLTNPGTDYFDLKLNNVSVSPVIVGSQYSQTTDPNNSSTTGSLTPVSVAPVSEPASMTLLLGPLLLLLGWRAAPALQHFVARRRAQNPVAAA
jgi:hypothetical protein